MRLVLNNKGVLVWIDDTPSTFVGMSERESK